MFGLIRHTILECNLKNLSENLKSSLTTLHLISIIKRVSYTDLQLLGLAKSYCSCAIETYQSDFEILGFSCNLVLTLG